VKKEGSVMEEMKPWLRDEVDALKKVLEKNHSGSDEVKKIRYCVKKIEYMLTRLEKEV
jgi:hypothetical protein